MHTLLKQSQGQSFTSSSSAGTCRSQRRPLFPGLPLSCNHAHPWRALLCRAQAAQVSELRSSTGSSRCDVRMEKVQAGRFTVRGTFTSAFPAEVVWKVITDYDRLSQVYSSIVSSRTRTVDNQLQIIQDCKWHFLLFSGTFQTRLSVREEPHHLRLTFNLLDGSIFMRDFVGQWQLTPQADGSCAVQHRLTVQPSVSPPPLFNGYTERIFCSQITGLLKDLQQDLSRQSA